MGGSNSSHKRSVTIDNRSSNGVINVSEDVVKRLKNETIAEGNFFKTIFFMFFFIKKFVKDQKQQVVPAKNQLKPQHRNRRAGRQICKNYKKRMPSLKLRSINQ